jgi:inner membrane protein
MPTILTHPAVPLAVGLGLGAGVIPVRLLIAGVIVSVLPDLDVIAFHLGFPYAHDFGHRGATHSFFFAATIALLGSAAMHYFHASVTRTFSFLLFAAASHGLLDAFTNGGMGIAFFWPFSSARYFAPVQVIEVSPLNMSRIFSARMGEVLMSELLWVWVPCLLLMLMLKLIRYCNRSINSNRI